jgi:LemA protein
MSTGKIITFLVIGGLVILVLWVFGSYNGLVNKEEKVNQTWSNVESQYQRRADLIPNLVATVKGYAEHERETLTEVVQARANATAVKVDPNHLTPDKIQQFQQNQDALGSALGRLLVVVEKYPDLKANENFKDLQAQLEGTENRIGIARQNFNESAMDYNASIRRFPGNIVAGIGGFERKGYFEAAQGAEKAPEVKF